MVHWREARQVRVLKALIGGLLIGGATAAFATHISGNPGVTHSQARSSQATETAEPRATPEAPSQTDQEHEQDDTRSGSDEQTLQGVMQSVRMESHRFVLLPDGQREIGTIAFDTKRPRSSKRMMPFPWSQGLMPSSRS